MLRGTAFANFGYGPLTVVFLDNLPANQDGGLRRILGSFDHVGGR